MFTYVYLIILFIMIIFTNEQRLWILKLKYNHQK